MISGLLFPTINSMYLPKKREKKKQTDERIFKEIGVILVRQQRILIHQKKYIIVLLFFDSYEIASNVNARDRKRQIYRERQSLTQSFTCIYMTARSLRNLVHSFIKNVIKTMVFC